MLELTELSTDIEAPVIAAGEVTLIVGEPLSILPPAESVVSIVKPEIVSVDMGLRKLVTENATSIPPETWVENAPVTVKVELANAHWRVAESTATVEHDIPPWKYSEGLEAEGFHFGKETLITLPAGIACVGLNLTSRFVVAPTT